MIHHTAVTCPYTDPFVLTELSAWYANIRISTQKVMTPEQFEQLIKTKAQEIKDYAVMVFPAEAGNTAIRFINDNFRKQGWQGSGFEAWKANKHNKTILVQSGHLRSATYYTTAPGQATIRNTEPYAQLHNEGGTVNVPVTDKMRKFAWAMYYKEAGKGIKKTKAGDQYQSISVGKEARKWRGLALTKKTFLNITVDQRQFMPTLASPSQILNDDIRSNIETELQRLFNS